jgi:hypothetical protein
MVLNLMDSLAVLIFVMDQQLMLLLEMRRVAATNS